MSCCSNDETTLQIFRGKEEKIPFKLKVDGEYIDFNGKTIEFIVGELKCQDWSEDGTDVVFYQKIEPNMEVTMLLFEISSEETEALTDSRYKWRVKVSDDPSEPIRTPLFNLIVNT